jgi:hypothetical protein
MQFKLRLIPTAVAAVLVAACGGGGGGGSSAVASNPSSGVAVDGYLNFSQVVCDTNENGVYDALEPVAYTGTNGKFVFPNGCAHSLLVSGGSSIDTGNIFVGLYKAPANSSVVSPFTTLLSAGMTAAQIATTMKLPAGVDITSMDPAAIDAAGNLLNPTLYKKSLALQQVLQKASEGLTALGDSAGSATTNAIYSQVVVELAALLKSGSPLLLSDTKTDPSVVNALIQAATKGVASSTIVDAKVAAAVSTANAVAVATVVAPAYTNQMDAILGAGSLPTGIADLVASKQSSTFVADFLGQNKSLVQTAAGTSAAVLNSLGSTIASSDAAGISTLNTSLVTFEETPALITAGFGAGADIIADTTPRATGKVLQIARGGGTGGLNYAGGSVTLASGIGFTSTRKTISAQVYSPLAGVPVMLKVDNASLSKAAGGNSSQASLDTASNETVVKGWQTLSWTFSTVDSTKTWDKIIFLPHIGTLAPAAGELFFYDDIVLNTDLVPIVSTKYLTLTNDSMTLVNGSVTTPFTLAQFQSAAGVATSWSLSSSATLKFSLSEIGSFTLSAGQKLSAAVEISETGSGHGLLQAYIKDVSVSKTGSNVTITVPATSNAMMYGLTSDATKRATVDFSTDVTGANTVLTTDPAGYNTLNFGDVINYTINNLSNQFTDISKLRGKYKVKLVISDLPLRQANGVVFNTSTINVPTALNPDKTVKTTAPVTGATIEGFITLTN